MWDFADGTVFLVLQVLPGNGPFNYHFTLVTVFALIGLGVSSLIKIISRS